MVMKSKTSICGGGHERRNAAAQLICSSKRNFHNPSHAEDVCLVCRTKAEYRVQTLVTLLPNENTPLVDGPRHKKSSVLQRLFEDSKILAFLRPVFVLVRVPDSICLCVEVYFC